jgi:hypothetical protein
MGFGRPHVQEVRKGDSKGGSNSFSWAFLSRPLRMRFCQNRATYHLLSIRVRFYLLTSKPRLASWPWMKGQDEMERLVTLWRGTWQYRVIHRTTNTLGS